MTSKEASLKQVIKILWMNSPKVKIMNRLMSGDVHSEVLLKMSELQTFTNYCLKCYNVTCPECRVHLSSFSSFISQLGGCSPSVHLCFQSLPTYQDIYLSSLLHSDLQTGYSSALWNKLKCLTAWMSLDDNFFEVRALSSRWGRMTYNKLSQLEGCVCSRFESL